METLDPQVLTNVIQSATREVFATMLGMEVVCGDPYIEQSPPPPADGVVSLIGLAGRWVGTGCVTCSGAFACLLTTQMLMAPADAVNDEVLDVVAEITNMILGNAKTALEEHLGPMGLSIPTVVYGKNFAAKSAGDGNWTVYPFQTEKGGIDVKIFLAPNRKPPLNIRPGFQHTCALEG